MEAEFDLLVRGGTVVDGTGGEPYEADVAVRKRRIRSIGRHLGRAGREIDARGLIVTPGFVDIHTHYDGQVTWGKPRQALVGAWRDHRRHGQLRRRLRARAGPTSTTY